MHFACAYIIICTSDRKFLLSAYHLVKYKLKDLRALSSSHVTNRGDIRMFGRHFVPIPSIIPQEARSQEFL